MTAQSPAKSFFVWTGFLSAAFALAAQLYLQAAGGGLSFPATLVNFLSYFTILTNILVLVCFATLLFGNEGTLSAFFERPVTQTAVMVNILVVGVIYNVMLRQLWNPQGLQRITDELLHAFNPMWFVVFWIIFTPKDRLRLGALLKWLAYPALYLVYTLLRGHYTGWYPYPFINVTEQGLSRVLVASAAITGFFVILFLLAAGIGRLAQRQRIR